MANNVTKTKAKKAAGEKNRFVTKPRVREREFPFKDEEFSTLADLIHEKTGIVLKLHKKDMVYSRLARRLRLHGLRSFRDYLVYLNGPQGEHEMSALVNAVTTNLTKFFREPHHFDHMASVALNEALERVSTGKQDRVRIWSAGCSSGEEAVSAAIILDRLLKARRMEDANAKILATDLDTNMLDIGRNGIFKAKSMTLVEGENQSYFRAHPKNPEIIKVSKGVRKYISFKSLNLLEEWPMKGPFDIIFCRNVMIYFDQQTKARLVKRFHDILHPDGWLYIGHSETLNNDHMGLKLFGRTTYQKINNEKAG